MVQSKESAVTPERFAQAQTYESYIGSIERNQARFEENYAGTSVPDDIVRRTKALMAKPNGPAKLLVIGEDWCPDVFRGMPVFQKFAEATGLEIRIMKRDENKDVIAEFMKDGEYESIPVAVFYTKDHRYIMHWIERPALANEEMRTILRPMYQKFAKPDMTPKEREEAKQQNIAFQNGPVWANWRDETLREVVSQLEAKVG